MEYEQRGPGLKVEYEEREGDPAVKTERWEPPDWRIQLAHIREMRRSRDAPVDHMGAETCYEPGAPAPVRPPHTHTHTHTHTQLSSHGQK